jgi:hypothetical protein
MFEIWVFQLRTARDVRRMCARSSNSGDELPVMLLPYGAFTGWAYVPKGGLGALCAVPKRIQAPVHE